MAYPDPNIAAQVVTFGQNIITDDMLFFDPQEPDDYGREKDPHITIKFGLTQSYKPEQMAEFLKGTKPFFIRITGMDIFQNPKFDVVKMNVEGEKLNRLRQIFDQLPNADKYKVYHPHMTLAYLRPGLGSRFQNRNIGKFAKVLIQRIVYSDRGKKASYLL
ncbi:MAG TPA: 2'-5' RNA ligase family protein [Bacteroidales bacterium]|nr:2'-5' RNA ligase family protein [Bacteroidales bacterium]